VEESHQRQGEAPESREWRVVARRRLYDARPWLDVWAEDVQLPDGRVIEDFYKLEMPDYVIVVPFVGDDVVVQRQYKHGPRSVGLHLPGGYLDPGEQPLDAARRELMEETGYEADVWTFLGTFANDGNRGAGRAHFFAARRTRQVRPPDGGDLEDSELMLLSLEELVAAARRGEVSLLSIVAAIGLAVIDSASR
jgi:ADP-ribose pyrophosphatase